MRKYIDGTINTILNKVKKQKLYGNDIVYTILHNFRHDLKFFVMYLLLIRLNCGRAIANKYSHAFSIDRINNTSDDVLYRLLLYFGAYFRYNHDRLSEEFFMDKLTYEHGIYVTNPYKFDYTLREILIMYRSKHRERIINSNIDEDRKVMMIVISAYNIFDIDDNETILYLLDDEYLIKYYYGLKGINIRDKLTDYIDQNIYGFIDMMLELRLNYSVEGINKYIISNPEYQRASITTILEEYKTECRPQLWLTSEDVIGK